MKILGFHSSHDAAYGILEDGIPIVHNETERFNRKKNAVADSLKLFIELNSDIKDIDYIATHRTCGVVDHKYHDSFEECKRLVKGGRSTDNKVFIVGHHQSHASNAFFTSNFKEALIITLDGGGVDNVDGSLHNELDIDSLTNDNSIMTCTTFWSGKDNKIEPIELIDGGKINLGYYWAICTSRIFGLGTWNDPRGDQAGTVMGMAALGSPEKYLSHFENLDNAKMQKEWGPINLDFLKREADTSEQNKFDIAASLQFKTEEVIKNLMTPHMEKYKPKNICLSGGVSLNCVSVGKMLDWFPGVNIYCDPIPYDGGLPLGAARYVYHHIFGNERIYDNPKNKSSYLGLTYSKEVIMDTIESVKDKVVFEKVDDDFVVDLLVNDDNVISVYGGGSESGRRALGNRSILADPRSSNMKDVINDKVKHRQWFRPFAPSVLREDVGEWFVHDIDSPYMSFCLKFKEGMENKVPAVLHFDGTARLQSVAEEDNEWYYKFIKKFKDKTGVPMVLNTSFNDREPIVETPEHAMNCFLRTNIDYLYFRDCNILVRKI